MPKRVQILLLPETMLSTLAGPLDIFTTTGTFWPLLMGQEPEALFEVELVSVARQPLTFPGGLTIHPQCDIKQAGPADVVYIPSIMVTPDGNLPSSVDQASLWLNQQYKNGAMLCSACTGAFVLAKTGLLDGLPATTHWAFSQKFATSFPEIMLKENSVLVLNEDAMLATAGANASWQDLMLYLIAKLTTATVADEVRRLFLIDGHVANQGAYSRSSLQVTTMDSEIARAQQWLQSNLAEPQPVEKVIQHGTLSSRTFKRRFKKHVGMTVIAYVQMLRIDTAKELLLTTKNSIEDVAYEVGYQDVSYFRRIFVRETGLTPSKYRNMYR